MTSKALWVPLEAKPGKEDDASALPLVEAEPGTRTWYAVRWGASSFGIFDTFDDEDGRQAHLSGRVAEALMAKADELFASPPQINQLDVIADKG